uniref:Exostosin GT47 domain-containing protein n=1 Tax=Zea mays TaxID=4577 RepID=A0A804N4A1_MAIZE
MHIDAHYPKCFVYYLILGSWLLSCLLHFEYFHLSRSSFAAPRSAALIVLPIAPDASFLPTPTVEAYNRQRSTSSSVVASPSQSSSQPWCEGRYVFMLDVPSRFDMLRDCVAGSPLFDDMWSWCAITVNAGLGPKIGPVAGNGSDGDTDIIPSTGWYSTDQYSLEVIFHNWMRRYECLTDDQTAATAVYVPYYPALELHQHLCGFNTTVRDGPSEAFLRWLSSQPTWAALGGRDHFMVAAKTTWMFRREPGGRDEGCGNNFLGQPEARNITVLTYESNIWAPRDIAVPYPSYFHPSSAGEVVAWQARARRGRCGMVDCSHGLEGSITCRSPRKLVSLFTSARFCLQPRGDSFARRSSIDSVMAGCIPVFFHRPSTLKAQYRWHEPEPGRTNSDDRRYYVLIDSNDVLEGRVDIEEELSRYTDDEVTAMREEVIKMIPRFLYKDPRVRFEGDMRDAFDIIIDEMIARMRRIKNGEQLIWKGDGEDRDEDLIASDS